MTPRQIDCNRNTPRGMTSQADRNGVEAVDLAPDSSSRSTIARQRRTRTHAVGDPRGGARATATTSASPIGRRSSVGRRSMRWERRVHRGGGPGSSQSAAASAIRRRALFACSAIAIAVVRRRAPCSAPAGGSRELKRCSWTSPSTSSGAVEPATRCVTAETTSPSPPCPPSPVAMNCRRDPRRVDPFARRLRRRRRRDPRRDGGPPSPLRHSLLLAVERTET